MRLQNTPKGRNWGFRRWAEITDRPELGFARMRNTDRSKKKKIYLDDFTAVFL